MVDCAKGRCAAWHSRSVLAGLHPQPRRRCLQQCHVAFPSLMPGQQLGASAPGIPSASPMSAGLVMPRSSNSRPIAMRGRIDASRSSCRIRRSSADCFGFAGGGGWCQPDEGKDTDRCQHRRGGQAKLLRPSRRLRRLGMSPVIVHIQCLVE